MYVVHGDVVARIWVREGQEHSEAELQEHSELQKAGVHGPM